MKIRILLSAFFFLIMGITAHAEYRVFLLKIAKKSADPKIPSTDYRLVESNLDPEQYRGYYPVAADEVVSYTDTWRCLGRTDGFKPFCPNPKGQNDRKPTSTP
jgi:hypothetical protein